LATTTPVKGEAAALRPANEPAPYYVKALALGIPAYLIGVHLWTWVFNLRAFLAGYADFSRLYTSGYLVRAGYRHELYDSAIRYQFENQITPGLALPFDHPAFEALLFAPFSYLSYRAAYFAFLAFNVGLLAIAFWLLKPWMENLRRIYWWLPAALFLAFLPVCAALIQGQDSILLLVLLAGGFRYLNQGRDFAAGLLMAVGLFKFQLVMPIALLFLFWRRWRLLSGFALGAITAVSASVWLTGISQSLAYVRVLQSMSIHSGSAAERAKNILEPTAMPNLRGLLFGLLDGHVTNLSLQVSTIILSCVLLVLVAKTALRNSETQLLLIAITTSTLASYHILIQDMTILLLPVVVMLDGYIGAEAGGSSDDRLKFRAAALAFTAPLLMSWAPSYFFLAAIPVLIFMFAISKPHSRAQAAA
jgi:hypothetical protein